MCLHPKNSLSSSELNCLTDDLNNEFTDLDAFNEFSNFCTYISSTTNIEHRNSDLVVMQLNVRSVISKQEDLNRLLITNDVDICTLNETWLSSKNKNLLKIREYDCVTKERSHNKKGGGVGIVISKKLHYKRCLDLENIDNMEYCIIEVFCGKGYCCGLLVQTAELK